MLVADAGTWGSSTPGPISVSFGWQRCASDGGACEPLTALGMLNGSNHTNDATRVAALQGDGYAPESSFGIWGSTTNQVHNGSVEVNLGNWSVWANSGNSANFPTIVRDLSDRKFGAASVLVTTNGNEPVQSAFAYASGVVGSTPYTASAWVRAPAGARMCIVFDQFDSTGTYIDSSPQLPFMGTGAWQRVSVSATTASAAVAANVLVGTCGSPTQAIQYRLDGLQLERGNLATPYVETTNGPVSRGDPALTAPSSVLPLDVGWAAFRVRPRWSGPTANQGAPTLLRVGPSLTDKLHIYYSTATLQWTLERNNGAQTPLRVTRVTNPGVPVTVVGTWSMTQTFLSADGAPFTSASVSQIPSGSPTLSLASIDGELLWVAMGAGTLTDAQAAALHAFGDADPKFSQLPPGARMLWSADTLAYEVPVTGGTYTTVATDVGYTFRLQVTATGAGGTTSVTSSLFGPLLP